MPPTKAHFTVSLPDLASRLQASGLDLLGSFAFGREERPFPERAHQPRALAIIGNVGSRLWPFFSKARQTRPDLTLDRWTEEVVGEIASAFALEAVYPFSGPPFHPFIQWAKRTGTLFSSPIGLTIHPDYGLWLAFRAALLIDHPSEQQETLNTEPVPARHPCVSCAGRPCLAACPVGAFTETGYDFNACLDHLATPVNACRQGGCRARIACPVGQQHRYQQDHAAFHMRQLLRAHGKT